MSKIDDILLEIKNYLRDENQGNDLKISQYATIYAKACKDINSKLDECSKLIAKGMMADAQRINVEMRPSLSSRAVKLALNKKLKTQYDQLCKLYNYTPAPDINLDVVNDLRSDKPNNELNDLIQQWRKIARSRENADKISLLREILSLDPPEAQMWRNNLQTLENQYIGDLQKQADSALSANDGDKLIELYKFLVDPDFLTPVQDNILQKYRPLILHTRKAHYREIVEQKCQEVFNAYSSMDVKRTKAQLAEYDKLTKDVLFQKDPELERSLEEARNYVKETEENLRKSAEFDNKLSELTQKLDQHGDYEIIENLYESLRQMDMPLDDVITKRVYNRREEYIAESNRRHTRKCIYGILLTIILIALGFVTFTIIQNYRSFLHHQDAMTKLMEEKNYEGVIELFNKTESETPLVLSFGDLNSFKLEAERLSQEQANQLKILTDLCAAAEVVLENSPVNLPELRKIHAAAQNIVPNINMPSELAERFRRIDADKTRLETIEQNRINREFLTAFTAITDRLKAADSQLSSPYCDLPATKINVANDIEQARKLLQSSKNVSENMLTRSSDLLTSLEQSITSKYEHAEKLYDLNKQLSNPDNIQHYIELLHELPATAPELVQSRWSYAVKNNELLKNIFASTQLKTNIYNWKTLEREIAQKKISTENNPFIADFTVLLPAKDFQTQITFLGNELKTDHFLKQFINPHYEFIFKAENGSIWRFYAINKPFIDRTPGMPAPKAIAVDVIKYSGSVGMPLQLKVSNKDGKIEFTALNKLDDISIPNKFTFLLNMDLRSSEAPQAMHYKIYSEFVDKLQYLDSPEILKETVISTLNELRNNDRINVVARVALTQKLLNFTPVISQYGYSLFMQKYISELNNISEKLDLDSWCHPAWEQNNRTTAEQVNNFFRNFDLKPFLKYSDLVREYHEIALSRKITAVGIVQIDSQNKLKLFYFDKSQEYQEYWFYQFDTATGKYQWRLFTPQEIQDGMAAETFALQHGDVIFSPMDNRSTYELSLQYRNKMQNLGAGTLIWPSTWPINAR